MELIVAVAAIIVMALLSGSVQSKLYDAYEETTARYFTEMHVTAASINTLVVGGLLAYFFHLSVLAVGAVSLLVALTWVFARLFIKRPEAMILWDKINLVRIALCLVVSVFATYVLSSTLGIVPGMGPLYVGLIYAACWALMFPI